MVEAGRFPGREGGLHEACDVGFPFVVGGGEFVDAEEFDVFGMTAVAPALRLAGCFGLGTEVGWVFGAPVWFRGEAALWRAMQVAHGVP